MAEHHRLDQPDVEGANNTVKYLSDHDSRAAGPARLFAGVSIHADIWTRIVAELDFETLKSLRCCSKWFALETARLLFAKITVDLDKSGIERMVTIASNDALSKFVRKLCIGPQKLLPECTSHGWLTGDPPGYYQHPHIFLTSRLLVDEYDAARGECSFLDDLMSTIPYTRFRGENLREINSPVVAPGCDLTREQRNYLALDDALLSFANLENVDLDIGWKFFTNWHRLSIPYESINQDQPPLVPAAPVAFMLRSLGWRNAFRNGLSSLHIHGNVPRWEPDDPESVWDAGRRALPQAERATTEVQMQAALMNDAFNRLTTLTIDLEVRGPLLPAVRMLSGPLTAARELKRLHLAIQHRLVDHPPPLRAGLDTLDTFVRCGTAWPGLKALTLSMCFSAAALLRALSDLAPSLESLTLTGCRLVCGSAWPRVYDGMRDLPFEALRQLRFSGNRDYDANTGRKISRGEDDLEGTVRHFSEIEGPVGATVERGCGPGVYDYILRRTDRKPPLYSFSIMYDHDGSD